MYIKELSNLDLDSASKFVYDITRNVENRTPLTPIAYNDIRSRFIKLMNHDFDDVLLCYKHNKIIGVIGVVVEIKRKQITVIDGPYTSDLCYDCLNKFLQFLKIKFSGFSIVFPLYKTNTELINDIKLLRGHQFADIITLKYHEIKSINKSEYVQKLNDDNFEHFAEIMKNSKLIYQPSKIKESELFNVYLDDNNTAIIIRKTNSYNEITEIISKNTVSDSMKNFIIETIKLNGEGFYKINLDIKDIDKINLLIKIGFKQSDNIQYFRLDF